MKNTLRHFVSMASLMLAIGVSGPGFSQDNNLMADLVLQVQQLQDEVRMLRGQVEDQAQEIENLKRRQRDQYLDLDRRITEVQDSTRNVNPVMPDNPVPPSLGQTDEPAPVYEADPQPVTPEAPVVTDTPVDTPLVETEQEAYDRAFQSLKDLNYADAAEGFYGFLQRYPQSEYADNAQYWLGESYYVTKNYDIALDAFQGLLDNYPQSPKVADALLKIGYTHYEMKQWGRARAALTQVQERYPNTTLSKLADSRLRSMRLEGHF